MLLVLTRIALVDHRDFLRLPARSALMTEHVVGGEFAGQMKEKPFHNGMIARVLFLQKLSSVRRGPSGSV
jgi:hypothetical protein